MRVLVGRLLRLIAVAAVGTLLVGIAAPAALERRTAPSARAAPTCAPPVFVLNSANGGVWVGSAPGVSFVSQNKQKLAHFRVAAGYRVTTVCVLTTNGRNQNDHTVHPVPPADGVANITVRLRTPFLRDDGDDDECEGDDGRVSPRDVDKETCILQVGFSSEVVPPPPQPITPVLECVARTAAAPGYVAYFGYTSQNAGSVSVPVGAENRFTPVPINRGQPTTFLPGTQAGVLGVPFDGQALTWEVRGRTATVSSASPACQGLLRVDKVLVPENDPGRFTLRINGQAPARARGVRSAGSTGTIPVPAGTHTVDEVAVPPTDLADYDTLVVCRTGGGQGPIVAEAQATSVSVNVARDESVVCIFTNTREVEPPPAPDVDLGVTKTVDPASVVLGGEVTWTVTVRNNGTTTATDVVAIDTLPEGIAPVEGSLDVSQGVSCEGGTCRADSLAPGASLTGTFRTRAAAIGEHVNVVRVGSREPDQDLRDNTASAAVLVTAPPTSDVVPQLECVEPLVGGVLRAHFGYVNPAGIPEIVPIGPRNRFTPEPGNRGQPDQFFPGSWADVFQADFRAAGLAWTVDGRTAVASTSSPRCEATLRIDKALLPEGDTGRFNLEIDGAPAGSGTNVGEAGTTGDVSVEAGIRTVGETAVPGTSLVNYAITVVCRDRRGTGDVIADGTTVPIPVRVAAGASVICVIRNQRRPPGPQPPPPPPPPPPASDVSIVKSASPPTVGVGGTYTTRIVVRNDGTAPAADVVVSEFVAPGTAYVSGEWSQGTCSAQTQSCSLGTVRPGQTVTIVVRVRATVVGARVNVVVVRRPPNETNGRDNHASGLVRVVGSLPSAQDRCRTLRLGRRSARASRPLRLTVAALDAFRRTLASVRLTARGAGVAASARTDRRGRAVFAVTPGRGGVLAVRAPGNRYCTGRVEVSAGAVAGRVRVPFTG